MALTQTPLRSLQCTTRRPSWNLRQKKTGENKKRKKDGFRKEDGTESFSGIFVIVSRLCLESTHPNVELGLVIGFNLSQHSRSV